MSIRRMMLFTLGGFFKSIISLFKTRVLSSGGTFEAETNLENQLNVLGSDLFNLASLIITPNGYKENLLFAVKPDKVGTNLLQQSETFENSYWSKPNGTITANDAIAPNGTITADLFTKTSAVKTVSTVWQSTITKFLSTGIYTLSVYIKPKTGNFALLRMDGSGNTANALFNFTTKTFTNTGVNIISSTYQELLNGWFRLSLTANVKNIAWRVDVCNLFDNPTGDAMWIWGAQLELGSTATDYISTTDRAIVNGTIGDLSVTRATTATRVNESGFIVDVPANVVRIDYSNGSPAILVEPQRTNLVYPSDIASTQVRAVTAVAHTLSFYGNGTVTLSGAFSGSLVGTGANNRVSLTFTPTAGNLTLTVSGTVMNWQLEAGISATSLIKTVSGSVTRNADVISNTNASNLIGQTEGCLFLDFVPTTIDSTARYISISNSSSASNGWFGIFASPSTNTFRFYGDGFDVNIGTLILNNRYKIVLNYKNGVATKIFINGVNVSTITANNTGKSYNLIQLATAPIGTRGNANFNCISLFKNIISDQQAIQLTTL